MPGEFKWHGPEFDRGTLAIELNSADNRNHWVSVRLRGAMGITKGGVVNRDGIGAVVSFTPRKSMNTAMQPILGGSSYASQHTLAANFGLGSAKKGQVDVLWPGGVRNRLYNLKRSEQILFPEIPCSYDAEWDSFAEYIDCVDDALDELIETGVITDKQARRFNTSAKKAFFDQ